MNKRKKVFSIIRTIIILAVAAHCAWSVYEGQNVEINMALLISMLFSALTFSLYNVQVQVYMYKGKKYAISRELKLKFDGVWYDAIEYKCLYNNPYGRVWVRTEKEFFELFKPVE